MPKQIMLNQITLCADGSIGLQWLKQVLDDDGTTVIFSEPHRSIVDFDGDGPSQVDAVVAHLKSMGYPVPAAAVARFKAFVAKFNQIANADPTITAARAAKIVAKQAALAAAQGEAKQP